jgi:integrase
LSVKSQYNAQNERIKRKYRLHVRRALKKDEKTILALSRHIRDFEIFTQFEGFEAFNENIADKYIQSLFNDNKSLSYITGNIRSLKDFLRWLERQRGYRSKINYNHIEYLNISKNERKEAKAINYQKAYKYEQIIETIQKMSDKTDKEKRDKAIISLQALCTLRISELRTVKMKNIVEEDGQYFIYVCPKSMSVKFAKTRHAVFMPLPDEISANVIQWRDYLRSLGFKDADPLFPKIDNLFWQKNLLKQTIKKEEVKPNTTIRAIFKKAFEAAGYEYIKPHSFRQTLARYAETQSPAFLNAVRQNLGHASIDTTLNSYGQLSVAEQRNIISRAAI